MNPSDKTSLYADVTTRIIAELEEGRLPWVQPWSAKHLSTPLGLPKNAATGRAYSGINILILWEAAAGTGDDPQQIAVLKRYSVFNVDQCDGLPKELTASPAPLPEREIIPHAEAAIAATGVDIRIGGAKAFYNPAHDFIAIPPQQAFFEQINFYRTAFHELSHRTGHESRLDREFTGQFASKSYVREELVAEFSAAFICAGLGIRPTVRHADYIGAWLEILREGEKAIFRGASLASKAAQILGIARARCGGRVVSVLEGGYDLGALAACTAGHVAVLMRG